jgi:hypothetical protein
MYNKQQTEKFISLHNKYRLLLSDNNEDKRQLAGILLELMKLLEFKKPTFPLAQKLRKLGDEKLLKVLWNMYGMYLNNEFDGKVSTPEKYIGSIISRQENDGILKTEAELIEKYKPFTIAIKKGNINIEDLKSEIEKDANRLGISIEEIDKKLDRLFKEKGLI